MSDLEYSICQYIHLLKIPTLRYICMSLKRKFEIFIGEVTGSIYFQISAELLIVQQKSGTYMTLSHVYPAVSQSRAS